MHTDRFCITQVAATVDALLGVPCHGGAAAPLPPVLHQAARSLAAPCDRVFLYNPDAIAQWIYAGRRPLFAPLEVRADLGLGPVTDNVGMVGTLLLWYAESGKKMRLGPYITTERYVPTVLNSPVHSFSVFMGIAL